jgi:titin
MTQRKSNKVRCIRRSLHASGERLELRALLSGQIFVVTTPADSTGGTTGGPAPLTLRQAILDANAAGGSNTINFDIPPGPRTINVVNGPLPVITAPVLIDGTSQPGYSGTPLVTVNGSDVASPGTGFNFVQNSSGSVIRGLGVTGFNFAAIMVDGASDITIGGSSAGQGNVITDNFEGVAISGSATAPIPVTSDITVEGNFIGTDASGTVALPNSYGVFISAANNNTIGGRLATARNVISGNTTAGIEILGASGNTVVGNDIGTNAAGDGVLANGTGVDISGSATANTIGGSIAADRNLISGNATAGVAIAGIGTSANLVAGNFIGTDTSGKAALANGTGVLISGGTATIIGGTTAGAGNLISGNTTAGLDLSGASVNGTQIEGNEIGTDTSGQLALANGIGVLVTAGTATTIGGTTSGAGNVISGNFTAGIDVDGAGAGGTQIVGNFIGTNPTGTAAVVRTGQANPLQALQNAGVAIITSLGNTIGGTTLAARNVISGNYVGVNLALISAQGNPNYVLGNLIGTDASGEKPLGNIVGIYINGAAANVVGGSGSGTASANVISGNTSVGVEILGSGSTANLIQGNLIGPAAGGQGAFLGSGGVFIQNVGIFIQDASENTIGGPSSATGNVISGNNAAGVFILTVSGVSAGNTIEGNLIGLSQSGSPTLENAGYGIVLANAPNNTIVRTGAAANRFGRNGIENIRIYQGPVGSSPEAAGTSARRSHGLGRASVRAARH